VRTVEQVVLNRTEVVGDQARQSLLDAQGTEDGVDLALHLACAGTEHPGLGLPAEVVEVVELGLGGD
jgi:hypothetical protein